MAKSYFEKTFKIIETRLQESSEAIQKLINAESRLKIEFPAALHEWFSYGKYAFIMNKFSNADPPVKVGRLQFIEEQYMPIRDENQGCIQWAIKKQDFNMQDPPVYFRDNENLKQWRLSANHFSDHILAFALEFGFVKYLGIQAIVEVWNPSEINMLHNLIPEFLITRDWATQYHFYTNRYAVVFWGTDEKICHQYNFWGKTSYDLKELLILLRKVHPSIVNELDFAEYLDF